jgi:hypothetical protein
MPDTNFDPTQNTGSDIGLTFDPTNPLEQTPDRITQPYVPNFGDDSTPKENIPAVNPITAPAAKQPTSFAELKNVVDAQYKAQNPVFSKVDFLNPTLTPQEYTNKFTSMPAGFVKGMDMEDYYAKQESSWKTLGKGVARLGASALFKTGEGLGFVGGLLNPENWDADIISKASDNGFAKVFNSLDEDLKNKWLPTYNEAEDRNKGFWGRAFTDLDFWTTDVADGLAFMASAWIPGLALSKLNLGVKIAQGLSRLRLGTTAAEAAIQGAGETANYLSKANSIFKTGVDKFNAWALATSSEAMFEATGVKDNIYKSLTLDPVTGLVPINPKTGVPYTESEKRTIAAAGAKNTFVYNSALLAGTNAIELSWLGKIAGGAEKGAVKGITGATTIGEELSLVPTPKSFLGKFLETKKGAFVKGALGGIAAEGFVEENGQLAIQRVNEHYGAQGKIADAFNIGELTDQYLSQTGKAILGKDPEAALNIGIGGILGLAGGVGEVKQDARDKAFTQAAVTAFNNTQQSWLKFGNPYKTEEVVSKDAEGNEIKTQRIVRDADNNPVLDADKMSGIVSSYRSIETALDEANSMTDMFKRDLLRDTAFSEYVRAHMEVGIEDTIFDKLDSIKKASPEDIAKLGFVLDKNIDQQINRYKSLATSIINQNKLMNSDIIFDDSTEDLARKTYMTSIAAQQAVFKNLLNDVSRESETLKAGILTSQNTSLSDGLVDQLNELEYRIKSQQEVIAAMEKLGGRTPAIEIAKQVLAELQEDKETLLKNNPDTAKTLKKGEDGLYKYEKSQRNEPGVSDQYIKKVKLKGELQNHNRNLGLEWAKYADTINGKKNFIESLKQNIVKPAEEEQTKAVAEKKPTTPTPSNKKKVTFIDEETGEEDFFEFENGKTYRVAKEDGTFDYYNNIQISLDGKTISYNLNFEGQVDTDAEELARFAKENGFEVFVRGGGKKGAAVKPKTEHPEGLESGSFIEDDPKTPTYISDKKKPKFENIGFYKTFGKHYLDKYDKDINTNFGSDRFFAFTSKFDTSNGGYVLKVITSKNDNFEIRQKDYEDDIKVVVMKKTVDKNKKVTYNYVDVNNNIIKDEDANADNIIYRSLSNIKDYTVDGLRNGDLYEVDESTTDEQLQSQIDLHSKWQDELLDRTEKGDVYLDVIGNSPGIQRVEYTTAIGKNNEPEIAKAPVEGRVVVEDPDWTSLRSASNPENHIALRVNVVDGGLAPGLLKGRAVLQEFYYDTDNKKHWNTKTTRVFNRLLNDTEKETAVQALARFSELLGRPKNNPLNLEEKNEFTLLFDYLKAVLNWSAPLEGVSPNKFIWVQNGLHVGEKVYKFDRETIMKNKATILNGVYHHINNVMLNKKESFQDITFKNNKAVPKGDLYTTYEEYLLAARENGEVPPVYTSLPKIDSDKPQRTNVYLLWRDPSQPEMGPIGAVAQRTYKTPKKEKGKTKEKTESKGSAAIDKVITGFINYKIKKINIYGIDIQHVKKGKSYYVKFYNPKNKKTFMSNPYSSVRQLIAGRDGMRSLISKLTNYKSSGYTATSKTSSKSGGIKNNIALAGVEDLVMSGDVTSTIRLDGYHDKFYKGDGVYRTESGALIDLEYKGKVKINKDRVKGRQVDLSKDEFAQGEGYESWDAFEEAATKWAGKTLVDGEYVHYYEISPSEKTEEDLEKPSKGGFNKKGSYEKTSNRKIASWEEYDESMDKKPATGKQSQKSTRKASGWGEYDKQQDEKDEEENTPPPPPKSNKSLEELRAQRKPVPTKQPSVTSQLNVPEGVYDTMEKAIANAKVVGRALQGVLHAYNVKTDEVVELARAGVEIVNNDLTAARAALKKALQRELPVDDEEVAYRMPIEEIEQKEDFKKLSEFMVKNLPQFPVYKMSELIHNKAWGAFYKGALYIHENAGYGTGFHEAFESVWAAYVSDQEREELAKEFRSREGKFTNPFTNETKAYKDASMYDVREMLAEEFSDYVKNDIEKDTEPGAIGKFFKNLWKMIKKLFGFNVNEKEEFYSNINNLFKAIGKGQFRNLTPIRELNKLAPAYKAVGNLTQIETSEILDALNYHFFGALYSQGNNINSILGSLSKEESNKLLNDLFEKSYTAVKNSQQLSFYPSIQAQLDAFKGDLYNVFKSNLERYGVEFKEIEQDEDDVTDTLGIRDSITVDPRKGVRTNVRLLLASIPQSKYVVKQGELKRVFVPSTTLRLPKLENAGKITLILLNELSNIVPIYNKDGERINVLTQMFDSLDANYKNADGTYKKDYTWIQSLKTRLKYEEADGTLIDASTISKEDMLLRVAFIKSFTNVRLSPEKLVVGEDGYIYNFNALGELNTQRIKTEWSNNIKQKIQEKLPTIFRIDPNGSMVINRESKYLADEFLAYLNFKSQIGLEDSLDILSKLGIEFSASLEDLQKYKGDLRTIAIILLELVNDGTVNGIKDLYNNQVVNQRINDLIDIEGKFSSEDNVLSYLNADGESEYAVTNTSLFSNVVNTLNTVKNLEELVQSCPWLGQIKETEKGKEVVLHPYQQDSDLLKPGGILFDKQGKRRGGKDNKVTFHNISGMLTDEKGETTAKLLFPERVANKIHYLLDNIVFTNINSDKSREYAIKVPGKLLISRDEIANFIDTKSSKTIVEKYKNQLLGEMAAAVQQKANPKYIQYYQKGVYNLGHFKNILSKQTIDKFKEEVLSKKPKAEYKITDENTNPHVDFVNNNLGVITKEITAYIGKEIYKTSEWLKDLDIFQRSPKGDGYITYAIDNNKLAEILKINYDLDKKPNSTNQVVVYKPEGAKENVTKLLLTEDDIDILSGILLTNEELLATEQHKLIYGHPAMYKDFAKRANGATSTKEQSVEDSDVIRWMDSNMERNDGKVRSEEQHQTTKIISFRDQNVVSLFYKDVVEGIFADMLESGMSKTQAEEKTGARFNDDGTIKEYIYDNEGKPTGAIKAYLELNEADAMAWGLPDAIRDMLFSTGKLTPQQEAQWEYEIAYEKLARHRKDSKDPGYKKITSKTELANIIKIVEEKGDPGYVFQVLKPQYFGYAVSDNITHPVFLKHAVQPKFFRHVEGTQYEKLYLAAQNAQVDIIGFESGQKVGAMTTEEGDLVPIYNEKGIVNVDVKNKKGYQLPEELPQLKLYSKFYGIQVEISSKPKNSVVRGTQVTKIVMVNFFENGQPINNNPELKALIEDYNNTLRSMIRLGKKTLLDELGLVKTDDGYVTKDLTRLIHILRKEAKDRDLPDNMIDAINAIKNEEGEQELEYKFDTLINREKIDNILNSIVDSRVISEKMTGKASVQVASTLYESNPRGFMYLKDGVYKTLTAKEIKSLTDEQRASVRMTSSNLKFYRNENGKVTGMDAYISWPFKEVSPEELGLTLKNGIYEIPENFKGIPEEFLKSIGFRIPTQASNSIENIYIKGFTPAANGDMIVVPSEIVGKAGSDFDIDKLNLYLAHCYLNGPKYSNPDFKPFMVNELARMGIPASSAETLLDGFTAEDFDRINKAAPSDKIKHLKNLTTSISDITDNEDEFRELDIIKRALVAYNKQYRGVKKLFYTQPGEETKESLQNKFIDVTRQLLERPENYAQMVTPNSTATLKGLATDINKAKIEAGTKSKEDESSPTFLRSFIGSSQTRERYLTAKRMVGIAALHTTFHSLAQVAGLRISSVFKASSIKYLLSVKGLEYKDVNIKLDHHEANEDGSYNIGYKTDVLGKMISDLFSEAVSGFVDGAKDPFVFDLNLSMDSAGTWFYLQHLGVPVEQISYLFNQPIMDAYFKEVSKNKSNFKDVNKQKLSKSNLFYKVITPYYSQLSSQNKNKIKGLNNRFSKKKTEANILKEINLINQNIEKFELEDLQKAVKLGKKADPRMQIAVLMNYLEYEAQARLLGNFMQGISYDNKKTKNIQENQLQVSRWIRSEKEMFIENPEAILENTFLGELKEQKEDIFKMFQNFFITLSPELQKAFAPIYAKLNNPDYIDSKENMSNLINRYQNFLLAYVLHTTPYINSDGKQETLNSIYSELLVGKNSLPKRVADYKKDRDPNISDNIVIKELLPLFSDDISSTVNSVKPFKSKMDSFQINNVIEGLDNLKSYAEQTGNVKLGKFVEDLAKFSIIQSGMQTGTLDFKKMLSKGVYSDFVRMILNNYSNSSDKAIDVKNVWRNFAQNNSNIKGIIGKAAPWLKVVNGEFTSTDIFSDYLLKSVKKTYVDGQKVDGRLLRKLAKEKRLFDAYELALFENIGPTEAGDKAIFRMIDKRGNGNRFTEIYKDERESIIARNIAEKVDPKKRRAESSDGWVKSNLKKKKQEELDETDYEDDEMREIDYKRKDVLKIIKAPGYIKESAKKYLNKEIFKIKQATQFIGTGNGNDSTTQRMEDVYDKVDLANTGVYSADDLIYVSSNGVRKNRVAPVENGVLKSVYKNIDKAIEAGASFIMDTAKHLENTYEYNIGELELAEYLASKGYQRDDVSGIWTPSKNIDKNSSITLEELEAALIDFLSTLPEDQLEKIESEVEDLVEEYKNIPFKYTVEDFIESLKCRIK